jgi:hypothetical protein
MSVKKLAGVAAWWAGGGGAEHMSCVT